MRMVLIGLLIAVGVACVLPEKAQACPFCPQGIWCVGWDENGPYCRCIQMEQHCILVGCGGSEAYCYNDQSLSAPMVAPDGTVLLLETRDARILAGDVRAIRPSAVGCREYVLSRSYDTQEAAALRSGTSLIVI